MKFSTHTEMVVATAQDVVLAADQGTIMEIGMSGFTYGDNDYLRKHHLPDMASKPFFFTSLAVMVIGSVMFVWAWRSRKGSSNMKEPLIESEGVMA